MAVTIKIRRGTKAQLDAITLALGELGFTTDTEEVYVGDGSNHHLVGKVYIDTFANRPAASVEGRLFFASDTNKTYMDDGSTWHLVGVTALSELSGDLDDISDGTTYGRVKNSELTTGFVDQINDGTNVVTAAQARGHIDTTNIHRVHNDSTTSSTTLWSSQKIADYVQGLLDGLDWQESVIDFYDPTTSTPPGPTTGDRYVSSATANGWTTDYIYEYNGSSWTEIVPNTGYATHNETDDIEYVYNSSGNWVARASATNHNTLSGLQGGAANEYYHLSFTEYTEATQYATNSQNGLMTSTDHGYLPTSNQKDALAGTNGTPSDTNRYVTDSDSRMTDARTPTAHATTHQHGGGDEVATATPAANAIPKATASGDLNAWITEVDGGTFV